MDSGGSEGQCPICRWEWSWDPSVDRNAHVSTCLDGGIPSSASPLPASTSPPSQPETADDRLTSSMRFLQSPDPPAQSTPHLLAPPLLPALLARSHTAGHITAATIASPWTHHTRGARGTLAQGASDVGWGCGYRNAQMVLSAAAAAPAYKVCLPGGKVPGIRKMQSTVEQSWREGYDPEGAAHFGEKLVGNRKWIGTTEVYVLFTSLGLRARIFDFPEKTGPMGTHTLLTNWIRDYFNPPTSASTPQPAATVNSTLMASRGDGVRRTNKAPLYLQHKGHSRTVVGIERSPSGEWSLLMFDPAKTVAMPLKKASEAYDVSLSEPRDVPQPLASGSGSAPRTAGGSGARQGNLSVIEIESSSDNEADERSSGPVRSVGAEDEEDKKKRKWGGFGLAARKRLAGGDASPGSSEKGNGRAGGTTVELDLSQHAKLLAPYRVNLKTLSRKDQYQILCLELDGPPLTESEKAARKQLKSTVVGG